MKKGLFLAVFCLGVSLSVPVELFGADISDRILATVGGEIITLSDVKEFPKRSRLEARFGILKGVGEDVLGEDILEKPVKNHSGSLAKSLDFLIDQKLVKQEIKRLDISASDQDIEESIQDVVKRNKMTLEALKTALARQGMSFDRYKKELAQQIQHLKFLGQVIYPRIRISDEDLASKTRGDSSEKAHLQARMALLRARAPEELSKYLEEVRAKTYVEIRK